MSTRAIVIRSLAVVVLALGSNVAVSWALAAAPRRAPRSQWRTLAADEPMARWMLDVHRMTDTPLLAREQHGLGVVRTEISTLDRRIIRARNLLMYPGDAVHYMERPEDDPRLVRKSDLIAQLTEQPPRITPPQFDFRWIESGWPCRGMEGGHRWIFARGGLVRRPYRSYELVRDNVVMQDDVLPLRPIAGPFAVNTAFYAAIFAFLLFAVPALRRRHRRRCGRCAACNYPVEAGDVCPECGSPIGRRDPSRPV